MAAGPPSCGIAPHRPGGLRVACKKTVERLPDHLGARTRGTGFSRWPTAPGFWKNRPMPWLFFRRHPDHRDGRVDRPRSRPHPIPRHHRPVHVRQHPRRLMLDAPRPARALRRRCPRPPSPPRPAWVVPPGGSSSTLSALSTPRTAHAPFARSVRTGLVRLPGGSPQTARPLRNFPSKNRITPPVLPLRRTPPPGRPARRPTPSPPPLSGYVSRYNRSPPDSHTPAPS